MRILVVGYYFWSKKALPDFLFGILFGQIFRSSISKVLDLFVKGLAAVYQRKCSFSSRKALSDRPLLPEGSLKLPKRMNFQKSTKPLLTI